MPTENVEHLRAHGPAAYDDLPVDQKLHVNDKIDGAAVFNPERPLGGRATPVAYLFEDHAPEAVLREWCRTNPSVADALSPREAHQLFAGHGRAWKEASREVVPDVWGEEAWDAAHAQPPNDGSEVGPRPKYTPAYFTAGGESSSE